jgi:hypothetical protein
VNDAEAQFLETLYQGITDKEALKRALELAQRMFNCLGGAFVSFDAHAPAADLAMISGLFEEYGRRYLQEFAAIDPSPAIFARLPVGTASTTDRLLSAEQRATMPFVNEFFRPIGLVETLGGNLFSDRGRFSMLGLQRGRDRPPFDDVDIASFERLIPHAARVLQLRRTFLRLNARNRALEAALDRSPIGFVLQRVEEANAIFVSRAMRDIAQRADGLSLDRSGRPRVAHPTARRRFDDLVADVARRGAGGIVTVPRSDGARDYVILVAPLPIGFADLARNHPDDAGVLVLVHDPDKRPQNAAEILQHAWRLPKGAARLVAALCADEDLKSFAEREGVTIHTVRWHLRTALTRTGVRTQAELVRLAVRLLRDIAIAVQ